MPYLISGGLLGTALVVLGSSFYFSFYVARGQAAARRQAAVLERLIQRLEEEPQTSANGAVVTVPGGSSFHRPACRVVAGKRISSTSDEAARGRGLRPCKVCEPALLS